MKERLRQIFFKPKPETEMPAPPAMEGHLIIRKEGQPERCDICHLADQLDPQTGQCLRCAGLPLQALLESHSQAHRAPAIEPPPANNNSRWLLAGLCIVMMLASMAYRL